MTKSVLIVEDLPELGKALLRNLFEAANEAEIPVAVDLVTNKEDALRLSGEKIYDLVSVDGRFPLVPDGDAFDYAGLVLVFHLRKMSRPPGSIIFYSADVSLLHTASLIPKNYLPVHVLSKVADDGTAWIDTCIKVLSGHPVTA